MTKTKLLQLARSRWGKAAKVQVTGLPVGDPQRVLVGRVTRLLGMAFFYCEASGATCHDAAVKAGLIIEKD